MPPAVDPEPRCIDPDWRAPPGVRVAVSTRSGGFSAGPWRGLNLGDHVGDEPDAVRRNRALLGEALALPGEPCWLRQVHGVAVADAAATGGVPEADAAYTDRPGRVCVVLTADCLPVVLAARGGREVAVAHCGWRGLAAGILDRALDCFRSAPAEVVAWLGPAIGPTAFEVGPEVREAFLHGATDPEGVAAAFVEGDPARGRYLADLYALARVALVSRGLREVAGGSFCTFADAERFYSYRRDGQTGRFATLAWIDPAQGRATMAP